MSSIYEQWQEAYSNLQKAKQAELMLRDAICASHLEDVLEGSRTTRFGNLKITATAKLNRNIDADVLDALWNDLTPEEQDCVVYKPTLVLGAYKKIEDTCAKLGEAVTVKPGQAALKVIEEYRDED